MLLGSPVAGAAAENPVPVLPPSLLVDQTGTLTGAEREGLAQHLKSIQASGRAQVAILVSGDIGDEPLAAYGLRIAEAWKLGRAGRDDGLLILAIPSRNAARIEVGYGLEDAIPDARASRLLDDLIPALERNELAEGLGRLLDDIDALLPADRAASAPKALSGEELLEAHPEWVLPFFLSLASPLALIPLFVMRRGYLLSGPLLALLLGLATWALRDFRLAAAVAGSALPLPYLWSLNNLSMADSAVLLAKWQIGARHVGNVVAVLALFCICALLLAFLLPPEPMYRWIAVLLAGVFAILLATFLFPGKPARYLSHGIPLTLLFAFLAFVAYFALQPLVAQPTTIALVVAGSLVALLEITLYLDGVEQQREALGQAGRQWSVVLCCASLLAIVPFALLALVRAATGDDWHQQLIDAVSGGGALTGGAWFAARIGLLATLKVGLGGLFGGGGAGRG
jgi:uncharacterized protein